MFLFSLVYRYRLDWCTSTDWSVVSVQCTGWSGVTVQAGLVYWYRLVWCTGTGWSGEHAQAGLVYRYKLE